MFTVNFSVGSRYLINRKKIREQVRKTFMAHGVDAASVDVSIVGSRRMKFLNENVMKHEGVTDVLSFSQRDPAEGEVFPLPADQPPHYGDVVVCYPVAVKEAAKKGKLVDEIVNFYIDHSIQHLLGIHHE
jgi:probable rRNA maturation factor